MGKQTTVYAPRVLGQGLLQAILSLFEPAALVYLSRQYWKSDNCDRYAWLQWKSGTYGNVSVDGVKNSYELNVAVKLICAKKTADNVNVIV